MLIIIYRNNDKAMLLYLAVIYQNEDIYFKIKKIFDDKFMYETDTILERGALEDTKNIFEESEERNQLRNIAINSAWDRKCQKVLEKFIETDKDNILLEQDTLYNIGKLSTKLMIFAMAKNVRIMRQKTSLIRKMIMYWDDEEGTNMDRRKIGDNINIGDILQVILEDNISDKKVIGFLDKYSKGDDQDIIATMLISKNKYSLTEKFFKSYDLSFKSAYVRIAIESDNFNIVFLLKSLFPQEFVDKEHLYIPSLIISLNRSFTNWLAKIKLLKSLIHIISYIDGETMFKFVLQSIQNEEPINNPLYYAPNLLLLSCNIIEICRLLVKKHDFLASYTSKIEEILIQIASSYIEAIEDEDQLRAIVFEKDFEHRDSLTLLSMYDVVQIMDNK
jgi:uncharacterized protein YbgA (DUF1722 family)